MTKGRRIGMRGIAAMMLALLTAGIIAGGAGAATPTPNALITRTGDFLAVHGDPQPGSGAAMQMQYSLGEASGTITPLVVDDATIEAAGGLVALERQRVTLTGIAGTTPQQAGTPPPLIVASITPAITRNYTRKHLTGAQQYITILCKFADVATEPNPPAYFDGLFSAAWPGLDAFWRQTSYNNINLAGSRIVGWYTLPQNKAYYTTTTGDIDRSRMTNDCTGVADNDVFFPDYVGINMMYNAPVGSYAWGGSYYITRDGQTKLYGTTWMPPWGYAAQTVLAHEMGHAFGLSHSGNPSGTTYKSAWDVMSDTWYNCAANTSPTYGCLGQSQIAYDKDLLGWIPDAQRSVYAGGNHTITLGPLDDGATPFNLIAVIPQAGSTTRFTTVELRRNIGSLNNIDKKLPGTAVIINDVDTTRINPAWVQGTDGYAGARFLVGSTYTAIGPTAGVNVTVAVTALTSTAATIIISDSLVLPVVLAPQGGVRLPAASPGTLSWTGFSTEYAGEITGPQGTTAFGWQTGTTYNLAALFTDPATHGMVYTWRVKGRLLGIETAWTDAQTFVVPPDAPHDLAAPSASCAGVTLTWSAITSPADSYRLSRNGTLIADMSATARRFTDITPLPNAPNRYTLVAVRNTIESDVSNAVSVPGPGCTSTIDPVPQTSRSTAPVPGATPDAALPRLTAPTTGPGIVPVPSRR